MKQNPMYKFLFLGLLVSLLSCGDDLEEENKKLKEQLNNKNQELVSKNQELVSKAQQIANEAHSKKVKAVMSTMIKIDGKLSTSNYAEKNGKIVKLAVTTLSSREDFNESSPSSPYTTITYQATYEDTLIKTLSSPKLVYTFTWEGGDLSELKEKKLSDNSYRTLTWQKQQISKEVHYNSDDKMVNSVTYTYNEKKQLTQRKAGYTTYQYSYDAEGRVSKYIEKEGTEYPTTMEYTYHQNGELATVTSSSVDQQVASRIKKNVYSLGKVENNRQIIFEEYYKNLLEVGANFRLNEATTRQYNALNQMVYELRKGFFSTKTYRVYQGADLIRLTTVSYGQRSDLTKPLIASDSTITEFAYSGGQKIKEVIMRYHNAPLKFRDKTERSYTYHAGTGQIEKLIFKEFQPTSADDATPQLTGTTTHQYTYNAQNSVVAYNYEHKGLLSGSKHIVKYGTYSELIQLKPTGYTTARVGEVEREGTLVATKETTDYTYDPNKKDFIKTKRSLFEKVVKAGYPYIKEESEYSYDSQTQAETKTKHVLVTEFFNDGDKAAKERKRYDPTTKRDIIEVNTENSLNDFLWNWKPKA